MKPKQPNLLQYMNFSKKNKSTNKAKYKTIMPNYIDSFSNKYPSYLQSSLNEDILLLKKKLKGYSKIHSHSSNNTNKNIEVNKKPQIASNISSISPISQINNYFLKKKNNNAYINKEIKNNLMLTSINNNSSIIYTSKDKEKISNNKSSSFRGINSNINYNYNINNINKNINKNVNKNVNNVYNNNPYEKKIKFNNNNKENKKYSMTSVSSRKVSKEREHPKKQEGANNINKINFNGLFKNFNYNKGKFLNNNYINNNKIINENTYMKNMHNNNYNNNNINKKLFVCDFNNVKKTKLLNDFLESYLKVPQSNNNRSTKNKSNNYSNSNISSNINTNINSNKNISSTANTSLIKNNCFPLSSSNYSPNNEEDFFKTAKISPRSSFPKKNQEFIQSHRINVKNKLQGNILSFYNNYKNNVNNNMIENSSNINLDNNNNISSHINKKKKSNMSVNMNITYNNKHFNMSNFGKNKNRSMINSDDIIENNFNYNINKTNKSNSLNKIQNINYIENYNYNYNYNLINKNTNNNNNIINNNHNSSNNSFINIKKSQNLIMNGNNILNNCKININNINYNNYNNSNNNINNNNINSNSNLNNNNYNHIFSEKMNHYNDKKNSIEIPNNNKAQNNKVNSHSQQELTQIKKNKNKNFTTNNSPINKNINIKNRISNNNSQSSTKINNNNINSYSSKNSKKNNNNNNNSIKAKETKKIKYEIKKKPKPKTNNNSLLFDNKIYEILELKHNLQKNNSEICISSEKNEKKGKEFSQKNGKNEEIEKDKDKDKESINNNYNNKNTISNLSSTTHDSNYYMEKCNSLSKYIRDYYRRHKNYPNTNLNFYLYGRLIGQGAFGKVNIGLNILSGRVVAIKSFNKKSLSTNGDNMKKILSETDLMKKLNHPNVTKILEMFEDDEYILIAMEYINGGNLFSFVKKRRKLSEKTAKFLFRQIILGIKHIHSKKIVHRDIKLENILIDLNNNIKICDFGIGRILKNEKQLLYDKCGTPMYMAPEILLSSKTKGYEGFPVDIWSSGISLYIMLSGTLPFNLKNNASSDMSEESNNNIELQYSIINKEPKKIEKISDEARDLLKGLLNKNPRKRLTIEQILNHPWLIENGKKNFKNKKYHLFTKAEMIMLSKTYIDYRNSLIEDLKENFTISNLKLENKENPDKTKKLKNITTKSSLLAPYNTLIQNEESFSDEGDNPDEFNDLANPNIILENDILIINNKIKEFNLNYELNNNGECDNGMLINTKTETISSSVNNQSQISSRNDNEDDLDDISDNDENEEHEKKTEKILEEIERIGYDRKYVMNCVKNNELCHASAIFYLMMNYKDI